MGVQRLGSPSDNDRDRAIGPVTRDPLAKSYVVPPSTEAEYKLCGVQKMRKPGGFV